MSSAASRLSAVSSQLSASAPKGLLAGQTAIVTGGIGRSTALLFAQEGAKVVVADLDAGKAQAVVDEIKKAGGQAIAVGGDVTAEDYPKKLVKATIDAFGDIHILINNAGFTADKMLHTTSDSHFELMLKVHNVAPFRLIREVAPYMRSKDPKKQTENRNIVNVSSTSGGERADESGSTDRLHGNVGQANYATAKAGVVGLTKTVAKEWGRFIRRPSQSASPSVQPLELGTNPSHCLLPGPFGVRCNTVAFGYITTRLTAAKELGEVITLPNGDRVELGIPGRGKNAQTAADRVPDIPLGRPGVPDEAARAVLFLASPLASYVSGHTLEVTGGRGI
ncbi:SPOSA6832_03543 [Sporobolomyces salmonicolor]|uniref:SPOSA6832_03543-mRNA-1:cds n=1 Tax=Sporidiobolus salmonicolor TaxID=5005 RepID=A0A0D6EP01_SPOSA|nr:SPOSA6832_03543 [Sporobolomyces salmonicolor]